jgi:hypothetical protein
MSLYRIFLSNHSRKVESFWVFFAEYLGKLNPCCSAAAGLPYNLSVLFTCVLVNLNGPSRCSEMNFDDFYCAFWQYFQSKITYPTPPSIQNYCQLHKTKQDWGIPSNSHIYQDTKYCNKSQNHQSAFVSQPIFASEFYYNLIFVFDGQRFRKKYGETDVQLHSLLKLGSTWR